MSEDDDDDGKAYKSDSDCKSQKSKRPIESMDIEVINNKTKRSYETALTDNDKDKDKLGSKRKFKGKQNLTLDASNLANSNLEIPNITLKVNKDNNDKAASQSEQQYSKDQDHSQNLNTILFSRENKGPYGVWLKKIKMDHEELNAYKIGSILYKKYTDINSIIRRSKFRVEVIFKSLSETNRLINDKSLVDFNLEVYIPGYRRFRKGIIRNIPTDISEEDIYAGIKAEVKVHEVRRLNRRNAAATNDNEKWIPSGSILITFVGQNLPREIVLFKVRSSVEPYVSRPLQCYNCFHDGHTSKTCRGKAGCIMCGELKHEESACTSKVPKCANCKGEHKSIDSKCPVYEDYFKVNVIMAYDNVSFVEAKKVIFGDSVKDHAPLRTKENYPELTHNILQRKKTTY